jgi:hypothetical protein
MIAGVRFPQAQPYSANPEGQKGGHRGLSGRSIAVRWRSILVMPKSECSTSKASEPALHWPYKSDRQLRHSQAHQNHRRSRCQMTD